jgi:hypothetical protein
MRRFIPVVCAIALVAFGVADAQSVVAPNANVNAVGTGQLNSLMRQATRTVQQGIHASELQALPPGAVIVGLSYRIYRSATTTWPTTNANWKNYEVTLAEAALPTAQWTSTFATNMKNPVLVRQGPLTVPKGTYAVTTSKPNPFDTFYLAFQKPYVYKGGDLVTFITHDGNDTASTCFFDGITATGSPPGLTMYATTFRATTASVTSTTFVITRIHYGFGPAGCTGKNGSLNLILSNNLAAPTPPPGTINIAVTNGVPNEAGAMIVAVTGAPAPLPLPGGCNLLILPPFLAVIPFIVDANGRYDVNLALPAVTLGTVAIQAYATDGSASAGYVVTNGINLTVKT